LAEKFGAPRPVSGEPESEPVREHDEEDAPPDPVPVEGIVGEPPLESGDESRAVQEEAAAPPVTVVRKGVPEVWVGIWLVGVAVLSVAGTLVAMGLGWIDGPAVVAWVRERLRGA
jgi:hypothetical protein